MKSQKSSNFEVLEAVIGVILSDSTGVLGLRARGK